MTETVPRIESYVDYDAKTKNYGMHTIKLVLPGMIIFYSYKEVIAFRDYSINNGQIRISENLWGDVTAKHLNHLDAGNKKARLPRDQFLRELKEACERHLMP